MNDTDANTASSGALRMLKRYLSPAAVFALSFGYAVGWGAFVMPGKLFLPDAGPLGTAVGVLVGAAGAPVFVAMMLAAVLTGVICAFVAAIRADAQLKSMPVYIFTADAELKDTYAEKGFTGALLKPATLESLQPLCAAL